MRPFRVAPLILLLAATAAPLRAAASDSVSARYTLTAWTAQTGLPTGDVLAMAQDLEGYLWLGTTTGLVRFDGFQFVPWGDRGEAAIPERGVPALVGSRDGSLWVGFTGIGGVSRIRRGEVVTYAERDGVQPGAVAAMLEDRLGTLWVGGRGGLSRFRNGHWERLHDVRGLRDADVYSLYEDQSGRLWIGTSEGVYMHTQLEDAFELRYPASPYVENFSEDGAGVLWVTDTHAIVKQLDSEATPEHSPSIRVPQSGWRLARDRRGQLWVAALGGGLMRLTHGAGSAPAIERFPYEDRIAGSPRSVFYDRDHNLWVGMRGGGLLRLSERSIVSNVQLDGLTNDGVRAVGVDDDGHVWVATGHSLNRFAGDARSVYSVAQTLMLHTDRHGSLWASTANGIGRIERGRFVPVVVASDIRWERVNSLATDAHDTLWLCSLEQGLMLWRHEKLQTLTDSPEISGKPCSSAYVDRRDRLWVGFNAGGVAVNENGAFHSFGAAEGLARGPVINMLEDRGGTMWVTTRAGVSRFENGRFTTVTPANGPFENIVSAFVEDEAGFLWLGVNAGAGVVRFDPREMDKVAVNPSHHIEYALFDVSDGMLGELRWQGRTAGARGADGRLWLATGTGVAVIDPRDLPDYPRPVPPRIEQVSADGRMLYPSRDLSLPFATSTLNIEYSTISLASASKLRFRYRLEGLEPDWVAAGSRRTASYTNLPSGHYRFRVSATNDGLWTEAAVWEFAVAPPYYRQRWFIAVSVSSLMLILGLAWWLRLRAVRHQYSLVVAERARMSREIHDTLLQSLAAIGVELESISTELDTSRSSGRESLRRLQRQVGHSLREARDSVWGLRLTSMKSRSLVDALGDLADTTSTTRHVRTELTVAGRPRRCSDDVELQLLRICQEAVTNAIRHGRASHIHIAIDFRGDQVALSVSDNGCGFVPGEHEAAAAVGEHLGLLGMTERAARVRGRVTITSSPGKGTVIEATAPVSA